MSVNERQRVLTLTDERAPSPSSHPGRQPDELGPPLLPDKAGCGRQSPALPAPETGLLTPGPW
jgi:hypothetical protein